MKTVPCASRRHRAAKLVWLSLFTALPLSVAEADQTIDVGSFVDLHSAVALANADTDGGTFTIRFTRSFSPGVDFELGQLFVALGSSTHLVIDGAEHVLNMSAIDRAFYVAQGNVTFTNLTIDNGYAKGGDGGSGGGGGMGAGGAIYIANRGDSTAVTLSNVRFIYNVAEGGNGGLKIIPNVDQEFTYDQGGGGGMGGNGGYGEVIARNSAKQTYGGGGGFGRNAHGGNYDAGPPIVLASDGGAGAYVGGASGGQGLEKHSHGIGGANGGGGGASYNEESGKWASGAAGGGGLNGGAGNEADFGGNGGYGGGGGAGSHGGGNGGWGGGGGASHLGDSSTGIGGFGGGGGFSESAGGTSGGFGGGNGQGDVDHRSVPRYGGGGMGAGGAIFLEKGATLLIADANLSHSTSFANNEVKGGTSAAGGAGSGSALGEEIFLGGDLTYYVAADAPMVSLTRLGGGGDTSDANVAGRDTNGDAQGGLIKTGGGTLRVMGFQTYAGATEVREGTFNLFTGNTYTSGYHIAAGATMEITMSGLTPAAITLEAANSKVIVTSNHIDLGNSTFSEGNITIDGSVDQLTTTSTDVKVGGSGTLRNFASLATFTSSTLTLKDTTWVDGSTLEYVLGEGLLTSIGGSDFSGITEEGLTISIIGLAAGISQGDRISLLTMEEETDFDLSLFTLTSNWDHFDGIFYQEMDGDTLVLGLEVTSIPEPGTTSLLIFGLGAAYLRYRQSRNRG